MYLVSSEEGALSSEPIVLYSTSLLCDSNFYTQFSLCSVNLAFRNNIELFRKLSKVGLSGPPLHWHQQCQTFEDEDTYIWVATALMYIVSKTGHNLF